MSQTGLPDGLKNTIGQYRRNTRGRGRELRRNQQISANATFSQWAGRGGATRPLPRKKHRRAPL